MVGSNLAIENNNQIIILGTVKQWKITSWYIDTISCHDEVNCYLNDLLL